MRANILSWTPIHLGIRRSWHARGLLRPAACRTGAIAFVIGETAAPAFAWRRGSGPPGTADGLPAAAALILDAATKVRHFGTRRVTALLVQPGRASKRRLCFEYREAVGERRRSARPSVAEALMRNLSAAAAMVRNRIDAARL